MWAGWSLALKFILDLVRLVDFYEQEAAAFSGR
jgi:hypothetical protein